MTDVDLRDAVLTPHARVQLARRGLNEEEVRRVLRTPDEVLPVREGRIVAQALVGRMLIRVFVDVDRVPPEVVTAYRTSKVDKYRRRP